MNDKVMDAVPSHARQSGAGRVKNKAPATVQITAEQLLREAWERKEPGPSVLPKQRIADLEELQEYQRNERQNFEMRIVRNRSHTPLWQRYARWEESQEEFARARSVWERAIDNDYRNPAVWLGYAEMEMRNRFINHARNVFDRAVALLPRVDQLWLKYAHMEEMLEQHELARLIYSRWLQWMPDVSAYFASIRFELRHGEVERARAGYELLVKAHTTAQTFIKYAKFEERQGEFARARGVYERASGLATELLGGGFFLSFAKFEERRKQPARARAIYQYALAKLPKEETEELHRAFVNFEKQQGDRQVLDGLLVEKKREELKQRLDENRLDYDSWFDLVQLEEAHSDDATIRQTYEEAISHKPPSKTKAAWRKYVYLWIAYAVWSELSTSTAPIEIYGRCLRSIPDKHKHFSFGKLWLLYAQAHLRRDDVASARKVLGTGLGVLPKKESLYRAYIDLETTLGEIGRARRIFQSWLERMPERGDIWLELARMEGELGEEKRVIGVLELASGVEGVSHRHEIWESLAKGVADGGKLEDAVKVWDKYVEVCEDARAWIAYGEFMMVDEERCREVFERGARALKERGVERREGMKEMKEVAKVWLKWEESLEGEEREGRVERVKKVIGGSQEVKGGVGNRLLAEAARRWKMGEG